MTVVSSSEDDRDHSEETRFHLLDNFLLGQEYTYYYKALELCTLNFQQLTKRTRL